MCLLLSIHSLRRHLAVLGQGTFHSQTLRTGISKASTFGSTLNAAVGTDAVLDVLLVKRKGRGAFDAQTTTSFGAEHLGRLEPVRANDARKLATLLVGFIGGTSAS